MARRSAQGITLPELLVVVSVIAVVLVVIGAITMQASRVFARTSPHIEPQASLMLALSRMKRDLREAYCVTVPSELTDSYGIEIIASLPEPIIRTNTGLPVVPAANRVNAETGRLIRSTDRLRYFLGRAGTPQWGPLPDGDTIYRAYTYRNPLTGLRTTQYKAIISGVVNRYNPANPNEEDMIFREVYTESNDITRIRITINVPTREKTPSGFQWVDHSLSNTFSVRNLGS